MVEFAFDIKPLFAEPISVVGSKLFPLNFNARSPRHSSQALQKMITIIDRMGELSAFAQELRTPITTAKKLSESEDQMLYIMVDITAGLNGKVCGILKVGTKRLFLYDKSHQVHEESKVPVILDFYVHESRQRLGYGKRLFDAMLARQKWEPCKCAVDKPSPKLMGFLKKHYGLNRIIPQGYNFILFDGYFEDEGQGDNPNVDWRNKRKFSSCNNNQKY